MSDLRRYDDRAWDRMFEFLDAQASTEGDDQARAELLEARIDVRPTIRHIQQMLEARKAREQLDLARTVRSAVVKELRDLAAPKVTDLRAALSQLIASTFSGEQLMAHFHKLEKAATEDDLRSLLDDVHRLAALSKPPLKRDTDAPAAE